jgi:hypothetical protein
VHETINFLKRALNRNPNAGMFGCYHVAEGFMYAQNETLQAVAPLESSDTFSIPGEELEAALSRTNVDPHLALGDGHLTVKAGRLRATIPCVPGAPPSIFTRDVTWRPMPDSVVPALARALPFMIGNNIIGWTAGIRLMNDRLTTINNICGIDVALPGWESPPSLVTKEGAEFLVADPPAEYGVKPGALLFRWPDERSVQVQLIHQEMPALVDNIFAQAGQEAPVAITQDWREAFTDAAAISDETVELRRDYLKVGKGSSSYVIEVHSEVPPEHVSYWAAKVLTPMVATAESWNPLAHPKPALFRGPALYGVVMGVARGR